MDRPAAVAVVAGLAATCLLTAVIALSGWDVSRLVVASPPHADDARAPDSLTLRESGFDGQFYYRTAIEPFSSDRWAAGIRFDRASLRHQRIGYPLIAFAFSLGDEDLVPTTLVLVNLLAFIVLGWLGGALARACGRHAFYGALFVFFPGFVFTLTRDLTEIVATVFLCAALLALRRERWFWAALALSLGAITRETMFVALMAIGVVGIYRWIKDRDLRLVLVAVPPTVVAGGWQLVVAQMWGELPILSSGEENVRFPLQGLFEAARDQLPPRSIASALWLISFALLVGTVAVAVTTLRASRAPSYEKIGMVAALLVVVALSPGWVEPASFLRQATEVYVFALLVLCSHTGRLVPLWPAVAGTWGINAAAEVLNAR